MDGGEGVGKEGVEGGVDLAWDVAWVFQGVDEVGMLEVSSTSRRHLMHHRNMCQLRILFQRWTGSGHMTALKR